MRKVVIGGVGLTSFERLPGRNVRVLAVDAANAALADAGRPAADVQRIFFGNAAAGVISQQEMIRGQAALRFHELAGTALINIENACASGGSALSLAFDEIRSGLLDVVLVIGVEFMNHADRLRAFNALHGSTDVEEIGEYEPGVRAAHSILMDFYSGVARDYLERYDATAEDFGRVAVKNRRHAAANPIAQFKSAQTLDDVMNARMIATPLTLPMCAPVTDGGCALLVCSEDYARRHQLRAVEILASEVAAQTAAGGSPVPVAAALAYERAGISNPRDFDVIELHDAAAPAELAQYSEIGLCEEGQAHHLLREGKTSLGGRWPVNTSGGLLSRGHALGATGCAQVAELCLQLRGEAQGRQVENARIALAINGGGWLASSYALTVATIVQAIKL